MTPDPAQSLANLRLERDAILLYDALGAIEKDENRAAAFHRIASNERRHAEVWATKLREAGVDVPESPARPRARVSAIILLARLFGTRAVSDLVTALEGDEEQIYGEQSSPEVEAIAADEREHAEIWRRLKDPDYHPERDIATRERWHRSGRSGTLRAVIFGVSDGLVSNLALVMGVAGAARDHGSFVLLAGVAGLLAGAFSMAAGEYISMQSQRELFERQIALERAEMEAMPERPGPPHHSAAARRATPARRPAGRCASQHVTPATPTTASWRVPAGSSRRSPSPSSIERPSAGSPKAIDPDSTAMTLS